MCCTISTGSNKGAIKLGVCWLRLGLAPCNPRSDTTTWWSTSLPATQSLISIPVQTAGRTAVSTSGLMLTGGSVERDWLLSTDYRGHQVSSLSLSSHTSHHTTRTSFPPPPALGTEPVHWFVRFDFCLFHLTHNNNNNDSAMSLHSEEFLPGCKVFSTKIPTTLLYLAVSQPSVVPRIRDNPTQGGAQPGTDRYFVWRKCSVVCGVRGDVHTEPPVRPGPAQVSAWKADVSFH